jgi:hypothetical protein
MRDKDLTKLRAWWAHKQGLLKEDQTATPNAVFLRSGWCRSVAGCNPYLTAFSRARLSRESVDLAVKSLEISELPAARGCTYVVPKQEYSVALSCGLGSGEQKIAIQLGATTEELQELENKVLEALAGGAKEPQLLRQELGSAVRNFGEPGKKKGLTTSLPVALGTLQSRGKIVRRPVSGRLDEQRYAYELWTANRPQNLEANADAALKKLAQLFFQWIGPATLGEFSVLAGVSAKAAKAAILDLDLFPLLENPELLILPNEREEFETFQAPQEPVYRLLSCLDTVILLRSDYSWLFSAPGMQRFLEIPGKTGSGTIAKELGFNAILDRGTVVGLWEYDFNERKVVSAFLEPVENSVLQEIQRTEQFIKDELGDARTFSLDSPKSRQPKLDRLKSVSAP